MRDAVARVMHRWALRSATTRRVRRIPPDRRPLAMAERWRTLQVDRQAPVSKKYRTLQTMVIVGWIALPLGVGGRLSVRVVRLAKRIFVNCHRSNQRVG